MVVECHNIAPCRAFTTFTAYTIYTLTANILGYKGGEG